MIIKGMMTHHLKQCQMATTPPHTIQIIKADTWLGNHQRVRWWGNKPRGDMGLKISDRGNRQVDIITPPGHHRIRIKTGMPPLFKKGEKCLPHLFKSRPFPYRATNEGVLHTGGITTQLLLGGTGPEVG